jgi:hypothetical protein
MSEETNHGDGDKPAVPSNPLFGVWIDVRSEQPKAEGSYLVYAPSADIDKPLVAIAWFTPGEGWSLLPQCWCNAITHWMPLPHNPPNPTGQGLRSNTLDPVVGGPND